MNTILEQLYLDEKINHIYNNCKWTPTLQNWKEIKESSVKKYGPNTIVFFQLGHFFECYFHDAHLIHKLTSQSLTSKNKKDPFAAPMSGSPIAGGYEKAKQILKKGYNVVIVEEQGVANTESFKREVTQVLTPGTHLAQIGGSDSCFIYSFCHNYEELGVSIIDINSNQVFVASEKFNLNNNNLDLFLEKIFNIYPPREIIKNSDFIFDFSKYNILINNYKTEEKLTFKHFKNKEAFFREHKLTALNKSLDNILAYLKEVHKTNLTYIDDFEFINSNDFFHLDALTIKNLEIFKNGDGSSNNSLFNIINKTYTSFGTRYLKLDLIMPLKDKNLIELKLNSISYILKEGLIESLGDILIGFGDIERLATRLSVNQCTPNDILELKKNLEQIEVLKSKISGFSNLYITELNENIKTFPNVIELIDQRLKNEGSNLAREGNIIKKGYNKELDKLLELTSGKQEWYNQYQAELIKETGIKNLKVSENNLSAYIEVKAGTKNIPENWIRGKMLKDSDRYTTEELNQFYRKSFDAIIKRNLLEYQLFEELRFKLNPYISQIHKTVKQIAKLDILASHVTLAFQNNYCKPQMSNENILDIKEGKHCVIEQLTQFTPNDTQFVENKNLHIITGPNMGGKSTYIRQISIIILLAQIGSFVPAKSATIGITDQIFTRVGANDNLSEGQSTFFLEMKEVSDILNQATSKSFIVFDEVGRGTSTDDGISIAQSLCEYILEKGIRTIFATHYHQLSSLENQYKSIENFSVSAIIKDGEKIKFNHKIKRGFAKNSYGIEIGDLAGLPETIIRRAKQLKKINGK